ncbi:MAG: sugar ABC transporter permease [Planctomycetota bacterium]
MSPGVSGAHGGGMIRGVLRRNAGWVWVSPWIVGLTVFFLIPMAMSLYYSLTDYNMLEAPLRVGLSNYASILRDELFWKAVRNTLVYAGVSIPLTALVSMAIAGLLDVDTRLSGVVRLFVFTPTVVPLVAAAMIWMWLFNSDAGLINAGLGAVGIQGPNWLQQQGWAMAALILMNLWSVGQAVVIYLGALQDIPETLYEAGELDGMGPIRRFVHIALPGIAHAVVFNSIIQTITAWQVFATPFIMTEGGPNRSTYFYSHYLYDNAFLFQRMGYASALGWVQTVLIAACALVPWRFARRLWSTR